MATARRVLFDDSFVVHVLVQEMIIPSSDRQCEGVPGAWQVVLALGKVWPHTFDSEAFFVDVSV